MIDDDYITFSELVEDLSGIDGNEEGLFNNEAVNMEIDQVEMELPVELSITVDESGKVEIGGTPPQYLVETTVMPVFHQLKVKLVKVKEFEKDG